MPYHAKRFDLDSIIRTLDKVPFSPPFLVILPVVALFLGNRGQSLNTVLQRAANLSTWQDLLCVRFRCISYMMLFILIKTVSRFFSLRAENNYVPQRDPPNWSQDVVAITGGATGIGKDIVETLSKKCKARIAVLDIAEPTYAQAAPGSPPILWIQTDVTSADAIAAAHQKIKEVFGTSPSIVIGCAGIAIGGPLLTTSSGIVDKTFKINSLQHILLAKEFVPFMAKNNHGHYVTVASSASYYTPPLLSAYCMSKAAALAFHEELRVELRVAYNAPRVRTSVVTPTKVRTLLGHALKDTDNSFIAPTLEPLEVATAITDAIEEGRSHSISQPMMTKMLPFVRAMPEWYRTFIAALGKTDGAVTAESIRSGLQAGYGKNWSKEDFDSILGEMAAQYDKSA
ncbi:hypothetical protein MVES1_001626 [Malassezia vespertilionis]|uniref:NAD(P)-binding protein n=1 Tax=Malassezia vespertilionis TaxID=2020962 RepID=A0A2N1JDB5_9BASI|nr:uncharacterized protein MVES1_001626 [Malassezia vespertilionis]PKI84551.1 hypothetical protein MVES_001528 [Malassezia vespertilionis]WFD06281.1 hypothetical protein MVES1_001626 [Malassezia vespertilionis]